MAIYEYNALTPSGRLMRGTLEAASGEQAGQVLKEMQLSVTSVQQLRQPKPRTAIGRNEFLLFNEQLASITKAGIPLEKALRELAGDLRSRRLRKLIDQIADDLEAGTDIQQAFEKHRNQFPPLYDRILNAGISSGRLSEMLTSLNRHLEMANQTRRIVLEALSYPAVIFFLAMTIFSGVFMFIIPQFRLIFADFDCELPAITELVLSLPQLVLPMWLTVAAIVLLCVILPPILKSSPSGRRFRESILFKLPLFGRVCRNGALTRFADALALLISTGCDLPAGLRLAAEASGSEILNNDANLLAQHLEQGQDILQATPLCRLIPNLMLYSIQLGSQRNELQDNLHHLADLYQRQTQIYQGRLSALLMPCLVVILGGFLAFIVTAMFMPMVTLISSFDS